MKIKMMAPKGSGHTPDNTMILIPSDRVLHFADMINPDQLPFYNFAGAEHFHGYEEDLQSLLSKPLSKQWDFINGGHGNIGSKQDVKDLLEYIADIRTEVGKQLEVAPTLQCWVTVTTLFGSNAGKMRSLTMYIPHWQTSMATCTVSIQAWLKHTRQWFSQIWLITN